LTCGTRKKKDSFKKFVKFISCVLVNRKILEIKFKELLMFLICLFFFSIVCKPDFKMNFNTRRFREQSGSNMAFYVENAIIENGGAKFSGNGKITLWGFMNKELGDEFAVRVRFKPYETEGGYGMVVSNCGLQGLPTVEISMQDKKARLIAKSATSSSPSVLEYPIFVSVFTFATKCITLR
jgi:hypothetical protein